MVGNSGTMMKNQADKAERSWLRRRYWKSVVMALASIVVFVTVYALILPAITKENQTYCGFETEHLHSDECFGKSLICGLDEDEAHIHTEESCWAEAFLCGLEEHIHDDMCYSNPEADLESAVIWEAALPQVRTGVAAEDILAVAQSQLGYTASEDNFQVTADGERKGISRYGQWFGGDPYADWNVPFVSFIMNYAETLPEQLRGSADAEEWLNWYAAEEKLTYKSEEVKPESGELVFFDRDLNGYADAIGIVWGLEEGQSVLLTIEGDRDSKVSSARYYLTDESIIAYTSMTEKEIPEDEGIETLLTDGQESSGEFEEIPGEYSADNSDQIPAEESSDGNAEPENIDEFLPVDENRTMSASGEIVDLTVTIPGSADLPQELTLNLVSIGSAFLPAEESGTGESETGSTEIHDFSFAVTTAEGDVFEPQGLMDAEIAFRDLNEGDEAVLTCFTAEGSEWTAAPGEDGVVRFQSDITDVYRLTVVRYSASADAESPENQDEIRENQVKTLTASGEGYEAILRPCDGAELPDDAWLDVQEVDSASDEYARYAEAAAGLEREEGTAVFSRFFTIAVYGENGEPIVPENGFETSLLLTEDAGAEDEDVIRIGAEDCAVLESGKENGAILFTADGNSVYGVTGYGKPAEEADPFAIRTLLYEGEDFEIELRYDGTVGFPEGVWLDVRELVPGTLEYEAYADATGTHVEDGYAISFARFFDIKVMDPDWSEVIPADPSRIGVEIRFKEKQTLTGEQDVNVIHFGEAAEEILDSESKVEEDGLENVTFTTGGFSVYGIFEVRELVTVVLTADGSRFTVTVTAPEEAGFPEDARLEAVEVDPLAEEYAAYQNEALDALKSAAGTDGRLLFARFFDITVYGPDGEVLEPEVPVEVRIAYDDAFSLKSENALLRVVHFGESGTEVIEADAGTDQAGDITEVVFTQGSFSVTGTVVYSEIVTEYLAADGNLYRITVTYTEEAQIPEGATLRLTEYEDNSAEYAAVSPLHRQTAQPDREELIEAEVIRVMEEQEAVKQHLMSNGDLEESDFVEMSEEEVRAIVAEYITEQPNEYRDMLSLLDITIFDAEGNEVEPMAPVEVELVMLELPENATAAGIKETLRVEHYAETEYGLEPQTVVHPDGSLGEIWVNPETGETTATFTTDSFSFYTVQWGQWTLSDQNNAKGNRASIYYGYMLNGKFKEFGWGVSRRVTLDRASVDANGTIFLNDISAFLENSTEFRNYTFVKALIRRDGANDYADSIKPLSNLDVIANPYDQSNFRNPGIKTLRDGGGEVTGYQVNILGKSPYTLGNADAIYVIFENPYGEGETDFNRTSSGTMGGSSYGLDAEGNSTPLGAPEHTKTLSENLSGGNKDNTYRLSLTATGKTTVTKDNTKIDLILVYDRTGSMQQNGIGTALMNAFKEVLYPGFEQFNTQFGQGTVTYAYIPFNNRANGPGYQGKTTDGYLYWIGQNFYNTVTGQGASGSGATNWEDALAEVRNVRPREDAKQIVIFLTDGDPTLRNTKGDADIGQTSAIHGTRAPSYNEWVWIKNGNTWQWNHGEWNSADDARYAYGAGSSADRNDYEAAKDFAKAIVDAGMEFYGIGYNPNSNELRFLRPLVNYAYGRPEGNVGDTTPIDHFYRTNDPDSIRAAFQDIIDSVARDLSYKFVSIDDELSAVAETTLVETPEDFEYFKYPAHVRFVDNMTDKNPCTFSSALAVDKDGNALDEDGNKCSVSGKDQAKRKNFSWADAPDAVYTPATGTSKGTVAWPLETVEVKDETYEITFTVYPNQQGWDTITMLSNHWNDETFDWGAHSLEKVTNPDGSVDIYRLNPDKTRGKKLLSTDENGLVKIASNDDATLTYKTVEHKVVETGGEQQEEITEDGPFTTNYPSPYMSVDPAKFTVRKIWKDTLIPRWTVNEVDLEVWHVSKGDVPLGDGKFKDSDTGDVTDKTEVAFVDEDNVTWYWSAYDETMRLSQTDNLAGYINIHEPNEDLGDWKKDDPLYAPWGYGSSKVGVDSFNNMKANGLLDDENYRINPTTGERLTNANGNLIQYFPYWETDLAIAPGLIATNISPNPLPGARGHFYALRERDGDVNEQYQILQHFELETKFVRPMKRDGAMDSESSLLRGTNSRKGELAITKMVLTQDRHEIHPDVPFQVTVVLTDKNGQPLKKDVMQIGTDGEPLYDDNGNRLYDRVIRDDIEYLVYDASGNVVKIDTINGSKTGSYEIGVTSAQLDQGASASAWHKLIEYDAASGSHKLVFSKLYADWTLVLTNLPTDAKWTVQETYNDNTYSNGYVFEGYTLPPERRGYDTLHPQPHFIQNRPHYSGGTVAYNADGTVKETNLNKITDYQTDAFHIKDDHNNLIAAQNGSAAMALSGYVSADAEELVDIHNTRIADNLEIKKIDEATKIPLQGAKFVLESFRPQTEWIWHQDVDDEGQPTGAPYWAERYVFDETTANPVMTTVKAPAHHPATVHIHGEQRYVVRGNVIGMLYAMPRTEWTDDYTPRPLDRDGNEITNVQWVTVPAGTDISGMQEGRDYVTQNGVNYILRPSTLATGKYEKVPDTTQTHVYYYVESGADGILRDTDPHHNALMSELPIIAGDSTLYDMYEIEAPEGYMTALEQMRENNISATWEDAKFTILVTSERMWDSQNNVSAPYVKYLDPRTGTEKTVVGVWDTDSKHWSFAFEITDQRGDSKVKMLKISSLTEVVTDGTAIDHANTPGLADAVFSLYRQVKTSGSNAVPTSDNQSSFEYHYNALASDYNTGHHAVGTELGGSIGYGASKIWTTKRYDKFRTDTDEGTLKLDDQGYLINSVTGERLKNKIGELLLYLPLYQSNGVEFVAAVNTDGVILTGLKTGADGVIDFGKLPYGTYWLFERQAPAGYAMGKPTKIVVDNKGVRYRNEGQDSGSVQDAYVSVNGNDVTYEIVVKNTPGGMELPNTGGLGADAYTWTGAVLTSAACVLMYIYFKRRKEVVRRE